MAKESQPDRSRENNRAAGEDATARSERDQTNRTGPDDDNTQKGGDRSDRAAVSGATGERGTSGGQNKPQPKDQDEKGMGHRRNR